MAWGVIARSAWRMLGLGLGLALPLADWAAGGPRVLTPAQRQCVQRLRQGVAIQAGSDAEASLQEICLGGPDRGQEGCVGGYLRRYSFLRRKPERAWSFCQPASGDRQACFDRLNERRVPEEIEDRYWICSNADPALRECLVDATGRRVFRRYADSQTFCMTPAPGRDCVLGMVTGGRAATVSEAVDICKYRSQDTRDCLVDFHRRRAPFDQGDIDDAEALVICKITHRAQRACVVKAIRDHFLGTLDDRVGICGLASRERGQCERILAQAAPGTTYAARSHVCGIPNYEIRACVLERFQEAMHSQGGLSRLLLGDPTAASFDRECAAEFANNLLHPLDAIAHGVGCDFER